MAKNLTLEEKADIVSEYLLCKNEEDIASLLHNYSRIYTTDITARKIKRWMSNSEIKNLAKSWANLP